jgi:hypothetical protein
VVADSRVGLVLFHLKLLNSDTACHDSDLLLHTDVPLAAVNLHVVFVDCFIAAPSSHEVRSLVPVIEVIDHLKEEIQTHIQVYVCILQVLFLVQGIIYVCLMMVSILLFDQVNYASRSLVFEDLKHGFIF